MVAFEAPALVEIHCENCGKFFFTAKEEHRALILDRIFIKCYRCKHEQGGMAPKPKTQ